MHQRVQGRGRKERTKELKRKLREAEAQHGKARGQLVTAAAARKLDEPCAAVASVPGAASPSRLTYTESASVVCTPAPLCQAQLCQARNAQRPPR